ncbi:MAG: hypothetical protein EBR82_74400, partial [Caulobacteraceae bacterium]|nr:hypothetical protein [Caulobacteraceae bacterium]
MFGVWDHAIAAVTGAAGAVTTLSVILGLSRSYVSRKDVEEIVNEKIRALGAEYVTYDRMDAQMQGIRQDVKDIHKRIDELPERIVTLLGN